MKIVLLNKPPEAGLHYTASDLQLGSPTTYTLDTFNPLGSSPPFSNEPVVEEYRSSERLGNPLARIARRRIPLVPIPKQLYLSPHSEDRAVTVSPSNRPIVDTEIVDSILNNKRRLVTPSIVDQSYAPVAEQIDLLNGMSNEVAATASEYTMAKLFQELNDTYRPGQAEILSERTDALRTALVISDAYTLKHSATVALRLRALLEKQNTLSGEEIYSAGAAGPLHDLGKIGTPEQILNAPRRLAPEEFARIQTHPEHGVLLINKLRLPKGLVDLDVIGLHHVSADGKAGYGFPRPPLSHPPSLPARACRVVDEFDAMTGNRPYREGMPPYIAAKILINNTKPNDRGVTNVDRTLAHQFLEMAGLNPSSIEQDITVEEDTLAELLRNSGKDPTQRNEFGQESVFDRAAVAELANKNGYRLDDLTKKINSPHRQPVRAQA